MQALGLLVGPGVGAILGRTPSYRVRCKPAWILESVEINVALRSSGLSTTAVPLMRYFGIPRTEAGNVVVLCLSSGRFFKCHACLVYAEQANKDNVRPLRAQACLDDYAPWLDPARAALFSTILKEARGSLGTITDRRLCRELMQLRGS